MMPKIGERRSWHRSPHCSKRRQLPAMPEKMESGACSCAGASRCPNHKIVFSSSTPCSAGAAEQGTGAAQAILICAHSMDRLYFLFLVSCSVGPMKRCRVLPTITACEKSDVKRRDGTQFFLGTAAPLWIGMKTVGNGRENVLTIPAPVFFCRERKREREGRTGKRNRYYGISRTEYFERERVDYDREAVTQNGNIDICNHLKQ